MMRRIAEFTVPRAHPALAGHFAGCPIVPAAWLLVLVDEACRKAFPGVVLRRLNHVRFRTPLGPEQALRIELERRDDGSVAFRCTCAGDRIVDGVAAP